MDNKQFLLERKQFNTWCELTLNKKGKVYTRGNTDKLSNFKRWAKELNLTPFQVLGIYMGKHIDAIYYYLKTGQEGPEGLVENLKDARNYIDLLYGLLSEFKK